MEMNINDDDIESWSYFSRKGIEKEKRENPEKYKDYEIEEYEEVSYMNYNSEERGYLWSSDCEYHSYPETEVRYRFRKKEARCE